MTAPPEPREQTDEDQRDSASHPRDNRVLRDNHGNPLPGSEPPTGERPDAGQPDAQGHPPT